MKKLLEKFKEVSIAIIPLVAVVLILHFSVARLDTQVIINFIIGTVMVVVGEVLFLAGVDNSIITMGEACGATISRFKHIWLVLIFGFIFGFICTMAEPDVLVLGGQVYDVSGGLIQPLILVIIIALGVGIYTALALLRAVTKIKLRTLLLISYAIVFILAAVSPNNLFLGISFDSGGVTTGPITVPFIMALGIGAASVKGGNKSDDSFGMVGLASVGPIMAMIIMGMFLKIDPSAFKPEGMYQVHTFGSVILETLGDVALGLAPIAVVFIIFQFIFIKLPMKKLLKILAGVAIVYVGLVLFLGGVNFGFSKAALDTGLKTAAAGSWKYILIPIGAVIGVATVYTEPAISVLGTQVEGVTSGLIKGKVLKLALAVGIGLAVMLGIVKSLFSISLWWFIIPGYAIALAFTFLSPGVFTAIAFDSGGVASGPMTATFSVPLVIGICSALDDSAILGAQVLEYAFGLVALVAMMPLIIIQFMGIMYKMKAAKLEKVRQAGEEPLVPAEEDKDYSGLV